MPFFLTRDVNAARKTGGRERGFYTYGEGGKGRGWMGSVFSCRVMVVCAGKLPRRRSEGLRGAAKTCRLAFADTSPTKRRNRGSASSPVDRTLPGGCQCCRWGLAPGWRTLMFCGACSVVLCIFFYLFLFSFMLFFILFGLRGLSVIESGARASSTSTLSVREP